MFPTIYCALPNQEGLIRNSGAVRDFPMESSWFEILAVLREGEVVLIRRTIITLHY